MIEKLKFIDEPKEGIATIYDFALYDTNKKINELIDAVNKLNTKEVAEVPEEVLKKVLE